MRGTGVPAAEAHHGRHEAWSWSPGAEVAPWPWRAVAGASSLGHAAGPATLRHSSALPCSACVPASASVPRRSLHAAHPCCAADQPRLPVGALVAVRLAPRCDGPREDLQHLHVTAKRSGRASCRTWRRRRSRQWRLAEVRCSGRTLLHTDLIAILATVRGSTSGRCAPGATRRRYSEWSGRRPPASV